MCFQHIVPPALVKGVYLDAVVCVLLQDLLGVFVCVEGVHEDQGHVGVVRLVQVLWEKRRRLWSKSLWNVQTADTGRTMRLKLTGKVKSALIFLGHLNPVLLLTLMTANAMLMVHILGNWKSELRIVSHLSKQPSSCESEKQDGCATAVVSVLSPCPHKTTQKVGVCSYSEGICKWEEEAVGILLPLPNVVRINTNKRRWRPLD